MSQPNRYGSIEEAVTYLQGHVARITGGVAHDYERLTDDPDELFDLLSAPDPETEERIINGWEVWWEASAPRADSRTGEIGSTYDRLYTVVIQGNRGIQDKRASMKAFRAHVDEICAFIDSHPDLDRTCALAGPATVPQFLTRKYGSHLCHYSKITVPVTLWRGRI